MKLFPPYLWLFLSLAFGLTLLFRILLSGAIIAEDLNLILGVSIVYGLAMGASGFLTGRANGSQNFIFDIGLRWNIATFVGWAVASECWFLFGNPAPVEQIGTVHWTLLFWGIGLAVHATVFLLINRSRNIRGVRKSEIFE